MEEIDGLTDRVRPYQPPSRKLAISKQMDHHYGLSLAGGYRNIRGLLYKRVF